LILKKQEFKDDEIPIFDEACVYKRGEYWQFRMWLVKENKIRNQIDAVDAETKWAALDLILTSSASVLALAKKMTKPETKTITRTVAVPKTKIVKQQTPPQTVPKDTERTDFTPVHPQKPLSNQQSNRAKR
jgi:hypothetical protein